MQVNSGLCVLSMPSLRKFLENSYTPSKPPTISRFKYNSSAIRKYRGMSSALWWVMNGRAAAPPGIDCRMGVSTSRYPRELKYSLMEVYTLFRLMNISFTPSFTTKST